MRGTLVYIMGFGHSGSTLLDMLLGSQEDTLSIGALTRGSRVITRGEERCSCGAVTKHCPLWHRALGDLGYPNLDISRTAFDFLLDRKRFWSYRSGRRVRCDMNEYAAVTRRVYDAVRAYSGQPILIDSSKSVHRAAALAAFMRDDMVLVHLVRDGRAVMYSYYKRGAQPVRALFSWLRSNVLAHIVARRYRGTVVVLRYRYLARHPRRAVSAILGRRVDTLDTVGAVRHQISGNVMRYQNLAEVQEEVTWKTGLPRRYKLVYWLVAWWYHLAFFSRLRGVVTL